MTQNLNSLLANHFGFSSFRAGQEEAIQSILAGHHTLVVMPTGAGKSLIYQLSALLLNGITLVISPLIALMKDQVDSLTRRNIPASFINSALPPSEQNRRLREMAHGAYRLVYVAPERLRSAVFHEALRSQEISLLAVDEAHCISEWGHDFRPDYLHIAQARSVLGNPLTVALTATATPYVQEDIIRLLGLDDAFRVVTGFNRPNLTLNVRYASSLASKLRALKELLSPNLSDNQSDLHGGAIIIYTGTRRDAEEVTEFVCDVVRLPAEFYHAGLTSDERTRVQNEFIEGKLNIICATNAFGMGIDRADVRQVIHYSLPGSLEAYYQEAGRAGRDDQPASATLLYDPADRALHEFFIANSALGENDLHAVYNALRNGEQIWATADDFSRITGLHPVQIKVGLAALEQAGALVRLGDEGLRMMFRKGAWNQPAIEKAILHGKEHLKRRKIQLDGIVRYAESNLCRRKIILDHFGDAGKADAIDCCDNCRSAGAGVRSKKEASQMTHGERAALIILDCIRRAKVKIGQRKLAQILHGSTAQDILKFHHDKNVYYSRLTAVKQRDVENLIEQLVEGEYIKVIGGEYPILSLTPRGENAIEQKQAIALKLPKSFNVTELKRTKAKLEAGGTLEYTAKLFADGFKPEEIAGERGLANITIYGHLAQLIEGGRIPVEQVVPADIREKIEKAIQKVGSTKNLTALRALLPEEISFEFIRCVIAGVQQSQAFSTKQDDAIKTYLTKPHPRPLVGSWDTGWALGFHSRFAGSDWIRSGVGDLTYRLKYDADTTVLPALIQQTLDLLQVHPEMIQADVIVPVPSSTKRKINPVGVFCDALASKIKIPMQPLVTKNRQTQPQKELNTLAQKRANVAGAFSPNGEIKGQRILLVDDLFDSGATLEEITCLLLKQGASQVNVLTLTRTIHSDA